MWPLRATLPKVLFVMCCAACTKPSFVLIQEDPSYWVAIGILSTENRSPFNSTILFFPPTAECHGVFAQSRFRCVLGEMGRFRERTGFREPGSGNRRRFHSMASDRFRGSEGGSRFRWVLTGSGSESGCGFQGFGFDGFWWVLTVSKVGTKLLPPWGWRNASGNAVQRVNAFV